MVRFLFDDVEIDPAAAEKVLAKPGARAALEAVRERSRRWTTGRPPRSRRRFARCPRRSTMKPKVVFQAVRVAVTGSTVSPPLFESLELLGKDVSLQRLRAAESIADAVALGGVDTPSQRG